MKMSNVSNFKLLDLFCGAGLAAWGYWLSGRFSEIVGVDLQDKYTTGYSFDHVQRDVLTLDYEFLSQFDFIHASPPCQAYSKATPRQHRKNHMRLIAAPHLICNAAGLSYVIENVEGSSRELRPNVVLSGRAFGLASDRRRYFHVSKLKRRIRKINMSSAANLNVSIDAHINQHNVSNMRSPQTFQVRAKMRRKEMIEALGLDVINPNVLRRIPVRCMNQGIPPVMTKSIAEVLIPEKIAIG